MPHQQRTGNRDHVGPGVDRQTPVGTRQNPASRHQQCNHNRCHRQFECAHRGALAVALAPAGGKKVRVALGKTMPIMVANRQALASAQAAAPAAGPPAAFMPTVQPKMATNNTLGPGAACATAMAVLNWPSLSQACSLTRKRCISGTVVIAPPTDISESDTKCKNSVVSSCHPQGFIRALPSVGPAGSNRPRPCLVHRAPAAPTPEECATSQWPQR